MHMARNRLWAQTRKNEQFHSVCIHRLICIELYFVLDFGGGCGCQLLVYLYVLCWGSLWLFSAETAVKQHPSHVRVLSSGTSQLH
jgi:hypothetical protein